MSAWDDNHFIAYIEVWASPPQGFPLYHRLYELDQAKGWCYLTAKGQQIYAQQKEHIKPLIALQEARLEAQMKQAAEEMLAEKRGDLVL